MTNEASIDNIIINIVKNPVTDQQTFNSSDDYDVPTSKPPSRDKLPDMCVQSHPYTKPVSKG